MTRANRSTLEQCALRCAGNLARTLEGRPVRASLRYANIPASLSASIVQLFAPCQQLGKIGTADDASRNLGDLSLAVKVSPRALE